MSDSPAILIDIGSDTIKAGLQTDEEPTCILPTLIGTPRKEPPNANNTQTYYIGDEALANRHRLSFSYPVDHGHIERWDQVELLLNHIFENRLKVQSQDGRVLLTEPPFASVRHREILVETMIETHQVQDVNLSIQGILSLYAAGKTTGISIEIGEGITQVVPVYDGYTSQNAMRRLDIGGQEITMYLQKLLSDAGYYVTSRTDYEHVRRIKETFAYVADDPFLEENKKELEREYVLPDQQTLRDGTGTIVLSTERFYCTEALFDPRLIERDCPSITNLVWQSIQACPIETRKSTLSAMVLSGGSCLFPGLIERFEKDIKKVTPPQARSSVRIEKNKNCLLGVWLGAKIFAEISRDSSHWISRTQWDEYGPAIVHRDDL